MKKMLHTNLVAFLFLVMIQLSPTKNNGVVWSFSSEQPLSRRSLMVGTVFTTVLSNPVRTLADDLVGIDTGVEVETLPGPDSKSLFNQARALENQGNMLAAGRLYERVTTISPQFIYGWSNLGNTQTALGDLMSAEASYSKAIRLCEISLQEDERFGVRRCSDLYVMLLNRGSLRLNNGQSQAGLKDLQQASVLRSRPDALILQNLARAKEQNGLYKQADSDYNLAISMTANEVNPFWLRSALVKLEIGDLQGGFDLAKRVENRFPEAPEVRAASAVFLARRGDLVAGQRKLLEIPDRARLKYVDRNYLTQTIAWPPAARETLAQITQAVGDGLPK